MSAVITAATLGVVISMAGPAQAAGGHARAAGNAAWTYFNDQGDKVSVVDNARDHEGAVGWIEVKQANGSWKPFSHVYEGGGYGSSVTVTQDVIRESSPMKIVSCIQNGPYGHPYNCGWIYVHGY